MKFLVILSGKRVLYTETKPEGHRGGT